MNTLKATELFEVDRDLSEFAKEESETFFTQGKPLLAAASYLSVSDFRRAIVTLIRANELYLAYHISKLFYPLALRETALLLCEKLEKYFQGDLCVRLLESDVGECKLQKKRLANMGLIKLQAADEASKYEALAKNEESPIK